MHALLRIGNRYCIAMDRLISADLFSAVRAETGTGVLPDLNKLESVCADLLAALAYIHSNGWIHGDIKPDNAMLGENNRAQWIDFGLATNLFRPAWLPSSGEITGTFSYIPPEAIIGEAISPSADMFSFGRMLSLLVCGRLPSWDPSIGTDAADARIVQQLPSNTPANIRELCTRLVRVVPGQRPTAAAAYEMLTGKSWELHLEQPCLPTRGKQSVPNPHLLKSTPLTATHAVTASDWEARLQYATRFGTRRAAQGKGTLVLIPGLSHLRCLLEQQVLATPCNEPRLVLNGICDSTEQTPLPGFDGILDQLSLWLQQLPPSLPRTWSNHCSANLALISECLARTLELPATPTAPTSRQASEQAATDVAQLLIQIAQERSLVLVMHNIEQLDSHSRLIVESLLTRRNNAPITIIGTIAQPVGPLQAMTVKWLADAADIDLSA
jgi:hypothetical protein